MQGWKAEVLSIELSTKSTLNGFFRPDTTKITLTEFWPNPRP